MMEEQVGNVYVDGAPFHDLFPIPLYSLRTLHALEPQCSQASLLIVPRELFLKDAALCPSGVCSLLCPHGARLLRTPLLPRIDRLTLNCIPPPLFLANAFVGESFSSLLEGRVCI